MMHNNLNSTKRSRVERGPSRCPSHFEISIENIILILYVYMLINT